MKSFIAISLIVGALGVTGVAMQDAEQRDRLEAIRTGLEGTAYENRIEGHIERVREDTLVGSVGVVGVIFLWLLTSVLSWGLWKFVAYVGAVLRVATK